MLKADILFSGVSFRGNLKENMKKKKEERVGGEIRNQPQRQFKSIYHLTFDPSLTQSQSDRHDLVLAAALFELKLRHCRGFSLPGNICVFLPHVPASLSFSLSGTLSR